MRRQAADTGDHGPTIYGADVKPQLRLYSQTGTGDTKFGLFWPGDGQRVLLFNDLINPGQNGGERLANRYSAFPLNASLRTSPETLTDGPRQEKT